MKYIFPTVLIGRYNDHILNATDKIIFLLLIECVCLFHNNKETNLCGVGMFNIIFIIN